MKPQRGNGSIYHRGDVWWLKYYRNGKPFREPAWQAAEAIQGWPVDRTKIGETEAAKILKHRVGAITTGTFRGPQTERTTVAQLAEDFLRFQKQNKRKSIDDVTARWKLHLNPHLGNLRATQITTQRVRQYVDDRQREGAANATINRELAALKTMFRLGAKSTPPVVTSLPIIGLLPEDNTREIVLPAEYVQPLADACSREGLWLRTMFELGITYGWRGLSELLPMRVHQLDLIEKTIRLKKGTTKNKDGRVVAMTTPVYELLKQCVTGKGPDDFVFTWPEGHKQAGKPVRHFYGAWNRAIEGAGVKLPDGEKLIFHDLRRTAANDLVDAQIGRKEVMAIMGHKTDAMLTRYDIVSRPGAHDTIARVERFKQQRALSRSNQNGHNLGTIGPDTTENDAADTTDVVPINH